MVRATLALTLVAWSCTQKVEPRGARPPGAGSDAAPTAPMPDTHAPTVTFLFDQRAEARVRVRLARTDRERERGLMYVQNLPPDEGMLFLFPEETMQSFWMKNTLIPLDMIFIRRDLTVAGVVAQAPPLTRDPRAVDAPSQFVLEVNGGWAAAHGVVAGTRVEFENLP